MKKLLLVSLFIFFLGCAGAKGGGSGEPRINPFLKGDCVDRAVVIRQDLKKEGYEAELILGTLKRDNGKIEGHCFVRYKNKGTGEWVVIDNY